MMHAWNGGRVARATALQCKNISCSTSQTAICRNATAWFSSSARNGMANGDKQNRSQKDVAAKGKGQGKNKPNWMLNLPKTTFPMRANAAVRELDSVPLVTEQLYAWQRSRKGLEEFVLHDGPPYANGALHCGHFLNKSLKDFICRFQLLNGKRVHYIPGWDCHGMPIEHKALGEHRKAQAKLAKKTKDKSKLVPPTPCEVRELARSFAVETVNAQRAEFQRWGVMAAWNREEDGSNAGGVYRTLSERYEAAQLGVFGELVKRGFVRRGLKPVFWSYSSKTALAEAEIEYENNHVSPSCFVDFRLLQSNHINGAEEDGALKVLQQVITQGRLLATIWTTTPWTLLSHVAISVHPELTYCLVTGSFVEEQQSGSVRLVAKKRVQDFTVRSMFSGDGDLIVLAEIPGTALQDLQYSHPLNNNNEDMSTEQDIFRILNGRHVTAETGTGLVHTAPSHGVDDFNVWREHGGTLEQCPNPVNDDGRFFLERHGEGGVVGRKRVGSDQVWAELEGMHVHKDGNVAVLDFLDSKGALAIPSETYKHRYPYDWRTKQPLITRATEQWFVNLSSLKLDAEQALRPVNLVPATSRSRLTSMLQGRDEWCISRQRVWGVPIPALFLDGDSKSVWMDEFVVQAAQEQVAKHGSDWWFAEEEPVEEMIAARANELRLMTGLPPKELAAGQRWRRGRDTLDVWFDSGCSWKAVLGNRDDCKAADVADISADVYLEGSDQHRGWFQSSLLTKVASTEQPCAPFKTIITHGFLLDENAEKMSKSAGNVILPGDVINGKGSFSSESAFGADVMRLWVASTDYTNDVSLGKTVVKDASDLVRKFRNVVRFLIGNLDDEFVERHNQTVESNQRIELDLRSLSPLDRYMLHKTREFCLASKKGYEAYRFRTVYSELSRFLSNEVSALYSTCAKDVLYCDDRKNSIARQNHQAVLWEVLRAITLVAAPILCFTAEEVHRVAKKELGFGISRDSDGESFSSIFQASYPQPPESWKLEAKEKRRWERVLELRSVTNGMVTDLEKSGKARSSEQVQVHIRLLQNDHWLDDFTDDSGRHELANMLENLLLVSDCSIVHGDSANDVDEHHVLATQVIDKVEVKLSLATKSLCPRCRRHTATEPDTNLGLCTRCDNVINGLSNEDKTRLIDSKELMT